MKEYMIDGYRLEGTGDGEVARYDVLEGARMVGHVWIGPDSVRVSVPNEEGRIVMDATHVKSDVADRLEAAVAAIRADAGGLGPWIADGEDMTGGALVDRSVLGYSLVQTCGACPEAYDVYLGGDKCGYLKLRNGKFRAEYRDEVVYRASPRGDGIFEAGEREHYLSEAVRAIEAARVQSR